MTTAKFKIKKGDRVIVQTGSDKGKTGIVLKVLPRLSALIVQGVNTVKRHTKASQTNVGGIIEKEAKIHISNVALIDPQDNTPTKVAYKILDDGTKVRFAKKSGHNI